MTEAATAPPTQVGDLLVEAGLLTARQLDQAVDAGTRTGSRPENISVAAGWVRGTDVRRVLADTWNLLYLDDLDTEQLDRDLLDGLDPAQLVEQGWFPVRRIGGERVLVATADAPTPLRRARIGGLLEADVVFAAVTGLDIDRAVARAFHGRVPDQACLGLWRRDDDRSARTVLNRRQRVLGGIVAALLLAGVAGEPHATVVAVVAAVGAAFLLGTGFTFAMCLYGLRTGPGPAAAEPAGAPVTPAEVSPPRDADLPTYTVLVPLYREAGVVADLVGRLAALDYPADRLQILLLVESDDDETRAAAAGADPPRTVTLVTVPGGAPRTRSTACQVGLYLASGEYLVCYDAEDRPDSGQLKAAVAAFRHGPPSLVCVQATPTWYNADENALTCMSTVEYGYWADHVRPGLAARRMPVPAGGGSHHFRTDALRVLGGWDPFNVTDDADLGVRAAAHGYTTGFLDSATSAEANPAYGNFIRQRSRWIKGYLQTALVHLRHPVELVRSTGWRAASGFVLLAGVGPVASLCLPPLYAMFAVSVALPPGALAPYLPGWVLWGGLTSLLLGNALLVYVSMIGAVRRRRYRLVAWALLTPGYQLVISVAAYRALWQLLTRPHYWEKTAHGLTAGDDAVPDPGYTGHHRNRGQQRGRRHGRHHRGYPVAT